MQFIYEVCIEIFFELMMYIVPEHTAKSTKYRSICLIVALFVLLVVLALFIFGCILIVDYDNDKGAIPITIAVIIAIIHIVVGLVLRSRD